MRCGRLGDKSTLGKSDGLVGVWEDEAWECEELEGM